MSLLQKQRGLLDSDEEEEEDKAAAAEAEEEPAATAKPVRTGAPGELPPSDSETESSDDEVGNVIVLYNSL